MRTALIAITAVLGSTAGGAGGCKDKKQPITSPVGSAGSGSTPTTTGSQSAAQPKPSVIELPKIAGTPALKTTKPIGADQREKLSKIDVKGFTKDVRRNEARGIEVRYVTDERPKIAVTLTTTPCFDCIPLELEQWKSKGEALKMFLAPELRDRPDTMFEVGATTLSGQPMIFTYQNGWGFKPDETGSEAGAYSHAYILYYNDGVNYVRAVAEYKDDKTTTRQEMVNLSPREDLERVAKAFLDAYTHAWQ